MTKTIRAFVLASDALPTSQVAEALEGVPEVGNVSTAEHLDLVEDFDLYTVPCEGDAGAANCTATVRLLRSRRPLARIAVYGDLPDRRVMKELVHDGCTLFVDVDDPRDVTLLTETACATARANRKTGGFGQVLRSLGELVGQWNKRMEMLQER